MGAATHIAALLQPQSGLAQNCEETLFGPRSEIRPHGHVLTPGRHIGAEEAEEDNEPLEQKMTHLAAELEAQFAESARPDQAIRANLKRLEHGR